MFVRGADNQKWNTGGIGEIKAFNAVSWAKIIIGYYSGKWN